jgi:hypothetical protein
VLCLAETGDASMWVPLHLEVCRLLEGGERLAAIELLTAHFGDTEALLTATVAGPSAG